MRLWCHLEGRLEALVRVLHWCSDLHKVLVVRSDGLRTLSENFSTFSMPDGRSLTKISCINKTRWFHAGY